jgi:uncharacterized protein
MWPACLAHAGNNAVIVPLATALLAGPDGLGIDGQQLLVALVLAAVALWRAGREARQAS